MAQYRITFTNGDAPIDVDGAVNIRPTLRAKYGYDPQYGHAGDLQSGGDRTLFWVDADAAENDDGARALGSVRSVDRDHAARKAAYAAE